MFKRSLFLVNIEEKVCILKLELRVNGGDLAAVVEDLLDDALCAEDLLELLVWVLYG